MRTEIEQIKERLDIVEVVGSYMKLERAGINWKARCPFHNEKTPSFMVSPSRQSFYCFGCNEKGDIFSFVEKFEGLDFKGALKTLAERAQVELTQGFAYTRDTGRDGTKERLFILLESVTAAFEENLKTNEVVLKYLNERGVSEHTIKKWRLGFAKNEWRETLALLESRGFSKHEMLDAGIIKKVEGAEKYYDTFRDRIVFPIADAAGRVIAFSGRVITNTTNAPKYLNSPETELFHKGEVLHGWHFAKEAMRKLDYAVLVEGQMDLIMSHQAGVPNTIASSGTALTIDHLKKIKRLTNRIIIAYDADLAGEKAAIRAAEIALGLEMEVKIADIPEGEDPASIALQDNEQWKNILRSAEHVIDFSIKRAKRQTTGNTLIKTVSKLVLPLLALLRSEMEKNHFVEKIARELSISKEAVQSDLTRVAKGEVVEDVVKEPPIPGAERMIVGIIFSDAHPEVRTRLETILSKEEVITLLEKYEDNKESIVFDIERYIQPGSIETVIDELLNRIEKDRLRQKLKEKTTALDQASESDRSALRTEIESIAEKLTS